jgi:phage major head subunit gpT-like protein
MEFSPSILAPLFQNLRLDFQSSYQDAPTFYQSVSTTVPSTGEQNVYGWMDFIPQLREWVGERYIRNVVARGFTATNKTFEDAFEIPRTKIEDDQYGLYSVRAAMMGRAAKLWPDVQVANAIINGGAATSLCYDGQPFFSASHPTDPSGEVSGTQSNALTTALDSTNLAAALAIGKKYVGRDGAPIGAFSMGRPILMVGPSLEKAGRDLIAANFLSPGVASGAAAANAPSTNTLFGMCELLVNPYITSATAWYLIDGSFPMKPFIWQLRAAPVFQNRTGEADDPVFARDAFQFGVRARGVATYGLWWLAIRGNV